jgi:hypothetical protein
MMKRTGFQEKQIRMNLMSSEFPASRTGGHPAMKKQINFG